MQAFIDKFSLSTLTVATYGHWVVSVRPAQTTFGALVLSLARPCSSLGELSSDESSELAVVYRDIEAVLREFVDYERINYLALMMVDHHVHFHVLPRYSMPRTFEGLEFPDAGWPGPPAGLASGPGDPAVVRAISERVRKLFAVRKGSQ